jgi:cytochrome b561
MSIDIKQEKYCIGVRILHWLVAISIFGIIASGIYMTGLENSPEKFEIYKWHKAFGLLSYILLILMLTLKTIKPISGLPDAFSQKEKLIITVVKKGLYAIITLTVLLGFIASNLHPKVEAFWFFGIEIPSFLEKNGELAHSIIEIHGIAGILVLVLAILHTAGVLKHRFSKDPSEKEKDILGRMI